MLPYVTDIVRSFEKLNLLMLFPIIDLVYSPFDMNILWSYTFCGNSVFEWAWNRMRLNLTYVQNSKNHKNSLRKTYSDMNVSWLYIKRTFAYSNFGAVAFNRFIIYIVLVLVVVLVVYDRFRTPIDVTWFDKSSNRIV